MKVPELFLETKAGGSLSPETLKLAESWIEKYPYFALAHLMQAKAAHKLGDVRALSLRAKAALYAPARAPYAEYIDEKYQIHVPPPPRITPTQREAQTPPPKTPTSSEDKEETSGDSQSIALPSTFLPKIHAYVQARQRILSAKIHKLKQEIAHAPINQPQSTPSPPPQKSTFTPALLTTESLIWRQKLFADSHIIPLPVEPIPLSPEKSSSSSPPDLPNSHSSPQLPSEPAPITEETKQSTPLEETSTSEPAPIISEEMKRFIPLEETPTSELAPITEETKQSTPLEETPTSEPAPIISEEMKRFIPLEETFVASRETVDLPSRDIYPKEDEETFVGKYIPPDFDIEAPIHLTTPEEHQELQPEKQEKVEKKSLEVLESKPALQSFLEEIKTHATQPPAPTLPKSEIERIRKTYLEDLIAKRPAHAMPTSPPNKSTSPIDELIAKLEKITPPTSTEPASILEVPLASTPSSTPLVYTESMAKVYWQQGDLAKAQEILRKLQTQNPDKQTLYSEWLKRIESGLPPPV